MSVHAVLKNEKGKNEITCVERLSSITFERTLTKNVETKPVFLFREKNSCFLKKKLSTSEMKKKFHPSEIAVK